VKTIVLGVNEYILNGDESEQLRVLLLLHIHVCGIMCAS
jgi:hypothetical protein